MPLTAPTFWDPVPFSWPVFGLLLAGLALLTVGYVVWLALERDRPDTSSRRLVDDAVREDRDHAELERRRLDADAGRIDSSPPELR